MFIRFLITFLFASCGVEKQMDQVLTPQSVTVNKVASSPDYSYELATDECTTGLQEAKSFQEICEKLQDHDLNRNCAYREREKLYSTNRCDT